MARRSDSSVSSAACCDCDSASRVSSSASFACISRNSPETGLRVMRSIAHYGLDISRAVFMTGKSPYPYIPAFNDALFLSANEEDVKSAIDVE